MNNIRLVAAAAMAILVSASVHAVVIDEFYYGTEGAGNDEWIELYNRSTMDIDMTGWQIAVANNGPFTVIHTITTGRDTGALIPASCFHLITDGPGTGTDYDENNIDLNLGRATGSVVYGIALLDDQGTTIDTVLYGPSGAANTYGLKDDDGYTSLSRVLLVVGDQAYRRKGDHQDTNNSADDFYGTGDQGQPVPVEVTRFGLE